MHRANTSAPSQLHNRPAKLPVFLMMLSGLITINGLSGCSKPETTHQEAVKPTIATVNYPLAYFAESIAGDSLTVHFPSITGDPAFWEPKTAAILAFQNADLILLNGANYAKWIPKVSLAQAKLVNTSSQFSKKLIPLEETTTHSHGADGAHAHGVTAFTTWLDPQLALLQAAAIRDAFSARWPHSKRLFTNRYAELASELTNLDRRMQTAFSKISPKPLLSSHPVYQYLASRYGLTMKSVHWEPDTLPDTEMWQQLDALLARHPATIMLWEAEPRAETKQKLAVRGVKTIVFAPCANRPSTDNYLTVMEQNLNNLKSASILTVK